MGVARINDFYDIETMGGGGGGGVGVNAIRNVEAVCGKCPVPGKHTEDEIDGSKGAAFYPCHHEILKPDPKLTPCRIVFNSSANFKGDFLHDYCAKGPELLKNLLGVLI